MKMNIYDIKENNVFSNLYVSDINLTIENL